MAGKRNQCGGDKAAGAQSTSKWLDPASVEQQRFERQARESQKLEALGRLAGGIVHDFNNLLTGVMLYSDLLLSTLPADMPERRYADEIRMAAQRGAGLIEQLMAFARQRVRDPVPLSLNLLIAGMNDMLQRLIGENVELVTMCAEPLGLVSADPSQMQQVIVNLVMNARDAMPNGGRVTIDTRTVEVGQAPDVNGGVQPGKYVCISVTDTGCGLDANTRAHLFEPFFTTKPKGQGTGLGLATAYGIVTQAGGTISVESELGQGARFTILLPVTNSADIQPLSKAAAGDGAGLRGTETILLVEDDALVRASIHNLLTQYGYKVLEARDGTRALSIAQRHKGAIHLLLADIVLPSLSGREVAARLAPLRPEMRVLYTSGYGDGAGGDAQMMAKPFNEKALAEKVRQALDVPAASVAGAP
jgi:nitrogen-specific signal transduction histidine kinase